MPLSTSTKVPKKNNKPAGCRSFGSHVCSAERVLEPASQCFGGAWRYAGRCAYHLGKCMHWSEREAAEVHQCRNDLKQGWQKSQQRPKEKQKGPLTCCGGRPKKSTLAFCCGFAVGTSALHLLGLHHRPPMSTRLFAHPDIRDIRASGWPLPEWMLMRISRTSQLNSEGPKSAGPKWVSFPGGPKCSCWFPFKKQRTNILLLVSLPHTHTHTHTTPKEKTHKEPSKNPCPPN